MHRYAIYKPLKNRRGVTLVETMMGLALVMLLTAVITGLFGAAMKSFTYSTRQTTVLSNARKALDGGSAKPGMAWQARQALSISGLTATQLTVNAPDGSTSQYGLSGQALSLTKSGLVTPLATNVTSLQLSYYNADASGRIMVSTDTASSSLVTAWMQTQQPGRKTYTFFTAARLRNRS
jgi:hypothetical protein